MKRTTIISLLIVTISLFTFAQDQCKVKNIPCYYHYWEGGIQASPQEHPQKWAEYRTIIEQKYPTGQTRLTWVKPGGRDYKCTITAIVLTSSNRPFTVIEKYEWNWGGVFYYIDFDAATKKKFEAAWKPLN